MSPSRLRTIRAVVAKDLRVARSSKAVTLPLIIVPLVFMVVLPIVLALLARLTPAQGTEDLMRQLESFSPTLLESLAGLEDAQKFVVLALVYMMASLFLVLPTMVAIVLPADRFAGDQDRKTHALLAVSPIAVCT